MALISEQRYVLGEIVGSGATSQVFVAQDGKLKRSVAYKQLLDEVSKDPTVRKCFHREAQALARVKHKNVVGVHDYSGKDASTLFLVMELIKGKHLAAWVAERGKLDEAMLWAVLAELGGALEACHALGVVHRDLKPENVILTAQGRLVLVDFGIARSYDTASTLGASAGTQVMGTPDFMSPEQATSEGELTGASDVFSLGSVIYFLATAKKPFEGDTVLQTLRKIISGTYTPLKQVRAELSAELTELVTRCMQPEVSARPSATEIFAAAKKQIGALQLKPEALLADFVAKGAKGLSATVKVKELDALFARLIVANSTNDQAEKRKVRKRILEIDPENETVFEMSAPAPVSAAPITIKMDDLPVLAPPRMFPRYAIAFLLGVAAATLFFQLR